MDLTQEGRPAVVPGVPVTRVISLKGRIHEYGPRLEHAPANGMYVGRRLTMGGWKLPQSAWANPFSVTQAGSPAAAVEMYAAWMAQPEQDALSARIVPELQGAVLLCWCAEGSPCHARWLACMADVAVLQVQYVDFCGDSFASRAPRRTVETVTGAGRWAGAL
jgi:Domain of unknown function (DUF4326)